MRSLPIAIALAIGTASPVAVAQPPPAESSAAELPPSPDAPGEESSPSAAAPADDPQPEQPAAPEDRARAAFEQGQNLYDQGKYEEALDAFLDAQRLYASPYHHHNIAKCYEALGRYELAVEYYRAYLRADPEDRPNIENKIARLEALADKSDAKTAPPPVPLQQPQQPNAGRRDRRARPGVVELATGGTLLGVGVALALGGGIGFGIRAANRSDKVDEIFSGGNPNGVGFEEAQQLDREGRGAEVGQFATIAGGGVLAIAGAVLIGIGVKKRGRSPQRAQLTAGGLSGRF